MVTNPKPVAKLTKAACPTAKIPWLVKAGCSIICAALVNIVFMQIVIAGKDSHQRIISIIPAVTEILFAIGADSQVVGVSSLDQHPPEVREFPKVGGLIDPNIEQIISLQPDLVITYASQSNLQSQLARAHIPTFSYTHGGLSQIIETIKQIGNLTGKTNEASHLTENIEQNLEYIRQKVSGKNRPRTLLVVVREPMTLRRIYASGGTGFLNDMLEISGGENVFGDINRESLQPTIETILTVAPEVIIEVRPDYALTVDQLARERNVWSRLAGIPAVLNDRVYILTGTEFMVPGPRVANATSRLAQVLHPDQF